jgi:hypothetical protein
MPRICSVFKVATRCISSAVSVPMLVCVTKMRGFAPDTLCTDPNAAMHSWMSLKPSSLRWPPSMVTARMNRGTCAKAGGMAAISKATHPHCNQ